MIRDMPWACTIVLLGALTALTGCGSPLRNAAYKGDLQTVRHLLDQGADPNEVHDLSICDPYEGLARSPLSCAAYGGHVQIAELLVKRGADVNFYADSRNQTPLMLAIRESNLRMVRLLLEHGAKVADAPTIACARGRGFTLTTCTPIEYAELRGNRKIVQLLEQAEVKQLAALQQGSQLATSLPSPAAPVMSSDVDRLPTVKAVSRKNAVAVVVGIEQYREKLPKADFADRDAKLVGEYLTKVLGYPEENVIVQVNERATGRDLEKYLENWLPNNVEKDGTVFIYYSGHGSPNPKTGDAYLVPYDGDPGFLEATGYPLKRLYAALEKLPAKDVTVVLDSCFSGAGGRSVIAQGLRPMGLSIENAIKAPGRTVVLSASSGEQVSSTYLNQGHGLLTYFFLKGLQGEGDVNKDGMIEMAELYEYVKPNVQKVARKQYNNEQTPQLLASPEVLRRGGGRLIEARNP